MDHFAPATPDVAAPSIRQFEIVPDGTWNIPHHRFHGPGVQDRGDALGGETCRHSCRLATRLPRSRDPQPPVAGSRPRVHPRQSREPGARQAEPGTNPEGLWIKIHAPTSPWGGPRPVTQTPKARGSPPPSGWARARCDRRCCASCRFGGDGCPWSAARCEP